MRYILIINGFPMSGKDLFCSMLGEISDIPVFTTSWVEYIKLIAPEYGWDGKKDLKGRKLLADLTDKNNNLCFDFVIEKEGTISSVKDEFIYCIHARRPKDIQDLKDYYTKLDDYRVITVCIRRFEVENRLQSNSADEEIFNFIYEYYLFNNLSISEFRGSTEIFYKDLVK